MGSDWNAAVLEQKYRILFADRTEAPLVFPAENLLRKETSMIFLRQVGEDIGSPTSIVTASLFFKRFLALVCGALHAMSWDSVGIDIALPNVVLTADKSWTLPRFVLRDAGVSRPQEGERALWREQYVRQIFQETVSPLIAALSAATKVREQILWSHTAYLLHFYYTRWQEAAPTLHLKRQMADDFFFLTKVADSSLLGGGKGRPFDTSYAEVPHPSGSGETIHIRRQCCYQYQVKGGRCCYTCPLLSDSERAESIRMHGS
ncbi:hypothetical protein KDJ56_18810 [Brevibacillus composti]|uniref:Aerobactin siderophore biosynthesis IucA/IucC-like C-terminal domain-containing protein n=1 Tax=Brevibacillus composti TaxID=2796470 RepID=A0A7T5EJS9_9BACL|nr:IucA/IucC family C-terminal-domain containing protein [Brevibacillus composti]QQE73899.1 hypothetical protein JD108_18870 [Brevibacillus composti]QUO40984.1 hypothetical protein KDJ56_18810 [Brevibacillus composti]